MRMFAQTAVLLLLWSGSIYAQNLYIVHCVDGICPSGTGSTNDLVVREIFTLSNSPETKFADWVAYRVTQDTIGTASGLNRDWTTDEFSGAARSLVPADYSGAYVELGVDRGHQAPLASFAGTVFWRSTNILSNITPQKSNLNQGPWANLEAVVRAAVYDRGPLYVVTGPVFDDDQEQMFLPNTEKDHMVPTGYFKVVSNGGGRVSAFYFDQDSERSMDYCAALTTLPEIEEISGLTIFPSMTAAPSGHLNVELFCGN